VTTVFGLEEDEIKALFKAGLKMMDNHKDQEGYEIKNSAFKVMRELGKLGYEPLGDTQVGDAPGDRTMCMWTLVKEL